MADPAWTEAGELVGIAAFALLCLWLAWRALREVKRPVAAPAPAPPRQLPVYLVRERRRAEARARWPWTERWQWTDPHARPRLGMTDVTSAYAALARALPAPTQPPLTRTLHR